MFVSNDMHNASACDYGDFVREKGKLFSRKPSRQQLASLYHTIEAHVSVISIVNSNII